MKECPRCQHIHFVKNGFVNEKQRYKCKNCHYQFTRKTPRGKPKTHKTLALLLYHINLICSARSPCLTTVCYIKRLVIPLIWYYTATVPQ